VFIEAARKAEQQKLAFLLRPPMPSPPQDREMVLVEPEPEAPPEAVTNVEDDSAYVLMSHLPNWQERFKTAKQLTGFLDKHPNEIHQKQYQSGKQYLRPRN